MLAARLRTVREKAWGAALVATVLVGVGACSGSSTPDPVSTPSAACPVNEAKRTQFAARVSEALPAQLEMALGTGYPQLRAVLIDLCGKPVYEKYHASRADDTHNVASVTKSFVGTLVGLALADGSLRGVDQTLAELLPAHRAVMTTPVASITLRELLTMTAGLDADLVDASVGPWIESDRFVEGILREGITSTRGEFHYSSASSHLLTAIVAQATGRPVLEYATEKLFSPLGISTTGAAQPLMEPSSVLSYDKADFAWPVDHQGNNFGGGWLKIRPRDMARLGQVYLDGGRWQGRQVVPAGWVRDATRAQVPTNSGSHGEHYGYQWWVTTAGGNRAFAAAGWGGQLIEVVPDISLVVVFSTHLDSTGVEPARVSAQTYEDLVSTVVVPALRNTP